MCVIAVKEDNVDLPSDANLIECARRNPDGVGIAWRKMGETDIHIKKDFVNVQTFLEWFKENIKKEDICIVHFRIATHGLVDEGNRHPFPITKNKDLLRKTELFCKFAVAHNGVIREYGKHKTFSDTQKFILDILAEDAIKNNLKDRAVMKLINSFIDGDRLAILDSEGSLYYFGKFFEEKGIMYSNESFKELPVSKIYDWSSSKISDMSDAEWGKFVKEYKGIEKLDTTISNVSNDGLIDGCDGCGKKKLIRSTSCDGYIFMLCKKCRYKVKKGTLVLDINKDEVLLENKVSEIHCDGCDILVKIEDIRQYGGGKFCDICYHEFIEYGDK